MFTERKIISLHAKEASIKKIIRCTVLLVLAMNVLSGCGDGSVTGIRIHNESGSPFDEVNIVPEGSDLPIIASLVGS